MIGSYPTSTSSCALPEFVGASLWDARRRETAPRPQVQAPPPQTSTQTDRAWRVVIGSRYDCVRGNNLEQHSSKRPRRHHEGRAGAHKSFREAVDARSSAAVAFDIRRVGDERFSGCAVRRTPLHFAVAASEVEIAKLLLRAGADAQARDATGTTPLLECQGPFMLFALVLPCMARLEGGGSDGGGVSCFGGRPEKPPAEAEEKVPLEEALSQ